MQTNREIKRGARSDCNLYVWGFICISTRLGRKEKKCFICHRTIQYPHTSLHKNSVFAPFLKNTKLNDFKLLPNAIYKYTAHI